MGKVAKQFAFVLAGALVAWCATQPLLVRHDAPLRLITLPQATPASWLSTLLPERAGTMLAARALDLVDSGEELDLLLHQAYTRMDDALGRVPTPAIATYLGMQSASRFDAVVIEPEARAPDGALIFLHGFAGNFNIYCWYMAQAVRGTGLLVVCPSVGPPGDFWSEQGFQTVRATLDYLHDRGIERVILAGLSNGAVGAGVLAPRFESELAGLVLISGAPRRAKPPRIPVLVIQGDGDEMMPAGLARAYAERSQHATYAPLHGGHFIFLSQHAAIATATDRWLRRSAIVSFLR